jgi:hypothetical protein
MNDDAIHDSFGDCISQITIDFGVDLSENETRRRLLLRGENASYPKTESSMKRFLTGDNGKTMRASYYVSPFVDFEEIYAEYHSETHGLSEEEGVGFLQHYGFPTDLFDLSPSIETARFFATHGGDDHSAGVIGVFPFEKVEACFTLTDLSTHPEALRPRRQLAFAARPPVGIVDLKDPKCTSLLGGRWYRFRKTDADLNFANSRATMMYPAETELAFFFSQDFDDFFRSHWTVDRGDNVQRDLVMKKLDLIRNQLR